MVGPRTKGSVRATGDLTEKGLQNPLTQRKRVHRVTALLLTQQSITILRYYDTVELFWSAFIGAANSVPEVSVKLKKDAGHPMYPASLLIAPSSFTQTLMEQRIPFYTPLHNTPSSLTVLAHLYAPLSLHPFSVNILGLCWTHAGLALIVS